MAPARYGARKFVAGFSSITCSLVYHLRAASLA